MICINGTITVSHTYHSVSKFDYLDYSICMGLFLSSQAPPSPYEYRKCCPGAIGCTECMWLTAPDRCDLPRFIHKDGRMIWYTGMRNRQVVHRGDDQPAVMHADGYCAYYHRGYLHRSNYPAVIASNSEMYWYYRGQHYIPRCVKL